MSLTPGKLAGMKAVSNERGVIAAAAMDQRGSLKKSLAKEQGVADVPDSALEEFKSLVTEVLTRHASAILLDPEFGLPASKRRNGKGLLLAYEKTGYDAALPGRLPDLLDVWSVRRLKEAGADCIKILLYYTPYEKTAINDHKHAWVERIGDECRAHDIPFFLETVGYDVHGEDEKGLGYAKRKPEIVTGSMEEFGKERYGVDVLKVEVPIQMEYVSGTRAFKGVQAYTRAEALEHFRTSASSTHKPFIYLSAGVSNPVFIETLELAIESGTSFNGVLCGRATWKDGIAVYAKQGAKAFEEWLNTKGVENINNVNKALESAKSWFDKVDMKAGALV
ncbi:tagatose 1,6-diphosphate aldolase [Acidipila rosea]|uniref:tagatose-bisphosphate aldolase n=1 Tax=Acidipila rosea TaxID=768535 RepID=A0A4R1L2D4_9BACT|nr:tagatose 1,6-diphosphate aldolase [Acidipila rosea]MBW4027935.1 tagatose 1,6-diphosphate aldolase [Acidobacteriota bacterium]MBW4045308.1 tagatose 1,6-diphosphate aldolase [Acidobacteriota bacterium]TCK72145.1 tagatose-bisphosphate aldolase [Acidipila rosea]